MSPKLGVENGQLTPCSTKPNCVNSFAENTKQYIDPIVMAGTASEVKTGILNILNGLKNAKIITTEDNYIRAEFTSKIFRFVDDVEFYFPSTDTNEITIHVRSGSRVGHSDFNVNRKRIEMMREKLTTLNNEN
ncbi:DUF1499 domain-containing protein [Desulforhopalus sp. 52FAK]